MLDTQQESGTHGAMSDSRMRQSLVIGPGLTAEEKGILLKSPIARYRYMDIKRAVTRQIEQDLKVFHIGTEILPLAASDHSDTHAFACSGYRVVLYDKNELGIPWVILLQLDKSFQKAINPLTVLRLVDSGGLEWLRGKPDRNGELAASWSDADTDLLERSKQFSLNLEVV